MEDDIKKKSNYRQKEKKKNVNMQEKHDNWEFLKN
jgi:hypothetical protein